MQRKLLNCRECIRSVDQSTWEIKDGKQCENKEENVPNGTSSDVESCALLLWSCLKAKIGLYEQNVLFLIHCSCSYMNCRLLGRVDGTETGNKANAFNPRIWTLWINLLFLSNKVEFFRQEKNVIGEAWLWHGRRPFPSISKSGREGTINTHNSSSPSQEWMPRGRATKTLDQEDSRVGR